MIKADTYIMVQFSSSILILQFLCLHLFFLIYSNLSNQWRDIVLTLVWIANDFMLFKKTRDPKMELITSQFNLAYIKLNLDKIIHPCKLIYFNKLLPVEKVFTVGRFTLSKNWMSNHKNGMNIINIYNLIVSYGYMNGFDSHRR